MTFADFWKTWPRHPRKGQRRLCAEKWAAKGLDAEAGHIVAHVEWLKTTDPWLKDGGAYIPAPLVYLNQERWDGAEIPKSAQSLAAEAKAREERAIRQSIEAAGLTAKPVMRKVA